MIAQTRLAKPCGTQTIGTLVDCTQLNYYQLLISTRQPTCLSIVWFRGHRSKVSEKVTTATFILFMYFIKKSTLLNIYEIF